MLKRVEEKSIQRLIHCSKQSPLFRWLLAVNMIPLSIHMEIPIQQFRPGTSKKGMHLSDMPSENPCHQSETVGIQTL
jgi:hypothetical protein